MNHWDLTTVDAPPRQPQILTTTGDARAIMIGLEAGESLSDHQVHESSWVTVVEGNVGVTATATGDTVHAGPGNLFQFEPGERHAVAATTDARLLLLLAPWPGVGHPSTRTLQ